MANLQRGEVVLRISLCVVTTIVLCIVMQGWNPPFGFRVGFTPTRDIVARDPFRMLDPIATEAARERARLQARYAYVNDPEPLIQLRASLRNTIAGLTAAKSYAQVDKKVWIKFLPENTKGKPKLSAKQAEERYKRFQKAFSDQENLVKLEKAVAAALAPFQERGLLTKLEQEPGHGNQEEIIVYTIGHPKNQKVVKVGDVLIGNGTEIKKSLDSQLNSPELAEEIFAWLHPHLKPTLSLDKIETKKAIAEASAAVEPIFVQYDAGQALAKAGQPLGAEQIELLRMEYDAAIAHRDLGQKIWRATAIMAIILTLLTLCTFYLQRRERPLLLNIRQIAIMLALGVLTVALARWTSEDAWRAEIVPMLLFGQIAAVAYHQELALFFSGVLSLIVVLALGLNFGELLALMSVTTAAILQLGRIRSRSKLIYVGMFSGIVAVLITIVVALLYNQPFDLPLVWDACRNGLLAVGAGFLMTGLLPFIEPMFGVLTDISLLELGDVAHPLLQELVRRAPSTYNHSITVGSIAEAAAESIGARGLLVRVGAYFHDIGKMLKPGYFVENQDSDVSRHETLVPAMSTLVIIAHIKDGANLARQHGLPVPIIDMIQQHHGTTLVGYFFERAKEQDQDAGEVDESTFRYPGPKPQSKEASVLMLADAVESASRTLVDPAPARIESLVRELAEQRLEDGQFDESGLTLRELRTIENSIIKSVIAIYHGRVKYPDQRTA